MTENIMVSSSGATGGGQISVPGGALVNGSVPTPTETDTPASGQAPALRTDYSNGRACIPKEPLDRGSVPWFL